MKFNLGESVEKVTGSYRAIGTIVAAFWTLDEKERYVFEFDNPRGMLHIFAPEQLEHVNSTRL